MAAAISNIAVGSLRNMETTAETTQVETKSLPGFPFETFTAYNAPKRNKPLLRATSTTIIIPSNRPMSRTSMKPEASSYVNTPYCRPNHAVSKAPIKAATDMGTISVTEKRTVNR